MTIKELMEYLQMHIDRGVSPETDVFLCTDTESGGYSLNSVTLDTQEEWNFPEEWNMPDQFIHLNG